MEIRDVLRVEDPNGLVIYMGAITPEQNQTAYVRAGCFQEGDAGYSRRPN